MSGLTDQFDLPYPVDSQAVDVPADIKVLAVKLDTVLRLFAEKAVTATKTELNNAIAVVNAKFPDYALLSTVNSHVSSLTSLIGTKLALAGGTMTGFITLHSNPTLANHASNKSYVDTNIVTIRDSKSAKPPSYPGTQIAVVSRDNKDEIALQWVDSLVSIWVGNTEVGAVATYDSLAAHKSDLKAHRTWATRVTITVSTGANSGGSLAITLPAGLFSSAPAVVGMAAINTEGWWAVRTAGSGTATAVTVQVHEVTGNNVVDTTVPFNLLMQQTST